MPLELTDTPAQIKHLNVRKEGPDDNKSLAIDVKIEAETDDGALATFDPLLNSALFRKDAPALRFPQMAPVKWNGEMEHMMLAVNKMEFNDVTLKGFVIDPYINGKSERRVRLTFSAALSPTGREVALLAEMVQDGVILGVMPAPALDLGPPSGTPT